ncbi:glycosyltransferase, partial [Candidatus Woesearchaeota archaeon]|nr:glycosyltransferase [Candidatus Woesearchaeota archaeon]
MKAIKETPLWYALLFEFRLPFRYKQRIKEKITQYKIAFNTKYISGKKHIKYKKDEAVVCSLVRNGENHIKSFIEYHIDKGFKHIFFLDNGSTDDTIKIAKKYEKVTILQNKLSFKEYQSSLRRYLVNRFCRNRWCLYLDIDEFFDYPFSDRLSLNKFLGYLNKNGYTAVITQMLDMFSDKKMSEIKPEKDKNLKNLYMFYDISYIKKKKYY